MSITENMDKIRRLAASFFGQEEIGVAIELAKPSGRPSSAMFVAGPSQAGFLFYATVCCYEVVTNGVKPVETVARILHSEGGNTPESALSALEILLTKMIKDKIEELSAGLIG